MSSQIAQKRKLVDGREASDYWGGGVNPDGSAKKTSRYVTLEDKQERRSELRQGRTLEKQAVRARFLLYRDARVFDEWLIHLGEQVLADSGSLSVDEQKLEAACSLN